VNQDSASGTGGSDAGLYVVLACHQRATFVQYGRTAGMAGERDLYTTKVGQSVPLDSVQEFSVTSSNFSAELGVPRVV